VSEAQRAWWATRVAVFTASLVGVWGLSGKPGDALPGWLFRWDRWDAQLFTKVAQFGYQGYPEHYPDRGVVAFFPGLPAVERGLHVFGLGYRAAGLLVSLFAGAVACAAMARIARLEGGDGRLPAHAVLALLLSPYAVFLAAGYSEALFLALALPAWLAARRGGWQLAGCLCALSCFVRITGVFLAIALVVEYVVQHRARIRPDAAWLMVPGLALLTLLVHQHEVTGDWLGWQHAQRDVWGRRFTNPVGAFHTTWRGAFGESGLTAEYTWSFRAEILAVLVGLALTCWLLWRRRWAESTYVGLQVATLATSSFYLSVARASLLWWPLWIGLAQLGLRRPALRTGYVAVSAPIMLVMVVVFTQGRWVG
jgi:hypothetical protein